MAGVICPLHWKWVNMSAKHRPLLPGSVGSACYLKDKTVTLSTKSAKYVLSSYQTLKQIMRVKEHTYSSSSSIVVSLNSKLVSKQIGTGWTINHDVVFWCMNI